ncbi:hypothetical protein [Zooshikella sp. RANM57]|uniref:hypothetical protein n=1 Tax=Zooshikella sp. RANM57 TaxID=3425863 RepID=UPI003D6EF030
MKVYLKIIFFTFLVASFYEKVFASEKSLLDDSELNQIVSLVLNHQRILAYLHPEVPGRVPVVIALTNPYSFRPIKLKMFGKPIIMATNRSQLGTAVKLKIECSVQICNVGIRYDPEGMFGNLSLSKRDNNWSVKNVEIFE